MFYRFLIIASSFVPLEILKNQKGSWVEIQAKGKLTKSINFFFMSLFAVLNPLVLWQISPSGVRLFAGAASVSMTASKILAHIPLWVRNPYFSGVQVYFYSNMHTVSVGST